MPTGARLAWSVVSGETACAPSCGKSLRQTSPLRTTPCYRHCYIQTLASFHTSESYTYQTETTATTRTTCGPGCSLRRFPKTGFAFSKITRRGLLLSSCYCSPSARLRCYRLQLASTAGTAPTIGMRTWQCLLHVVNTRLWLNSQETEAFGGLSFALEAYPNLKVLDLIGWNMRAGDAILPDPERSLSRITQAGMFAKLTHLHLVCIVVARGSHCSLLSHLNVPSLQKLELARSDHIGPFLRGLISTYATT
jgi:hypothetical protein